MAKPARQVVVRPLKEREGLLVLEALFERPMNLSEIADSISNKVEGPDISQNNLLAIIARLGNKVKTVTAMSDVYYHLGPAAYETQVGMKVELLFENLRAYRRCVRELKHSGQ